MTRNYPRYTKPVQDDRSESNSRNTDLPVWVAINLCAGGHRDASSIWEAPSQSEYQWVEMCLNEWARLGDIEPGTYCWGEESITAAAA